MTSYTPEVEAAFKSVPNPNPKFVVDVSERPDYPGLIFLQTYEPVIQSLSTAEKIEFAQYLYAARDAIRVICPCDLIKIDDVPPHAAVVRAAKEKIKRGRERGNHGL